MSCDLAGHPGLMRGERLAAELGLLSHYPDLMRPEHMAAALGWHVEYMRHLCREGAIPGAFKLGSRWFCPKPDFLAWVRSHE